MRCRCRRYTFLKFVGDLFLLLITQGLWVLYIIWRLFRNDRCCCAWRRYAC